MAGRPDVSCPLPPDPPGIRALVCEAIGKIRARSKFQNFKISGVGSKQGRGKVEAGSILGRGRVDAKSSSQRCFFVYNWVSSARSYRVPAIVYTVKAHLYRKKHRSKFQNFKVSKFQTLDLF